MKTQTTFTFKSFNELSTNELHDILQLRNEVFVVEQDCVYQDIDNKDLESIHLLMYLKDALIGYMRIVPKGLTFEEISIGRVCIKQSARKQGLAEKGMILCIEYIKNQLNETTIRISAQEYLLDFYQKLGFKAISQTYLEDGLPHIEMLKE